MMTSKSLMYKCENKGVFHIDGTYKLIKNRFPVMGNNSHINFNIIFILILIYKLVFGITDIAGEFHPIAYNITSHETEIDFKNFFSALTKLAAQMGINFSPEFIMMDSSDATYNAVESVFPNSMILMCYFHMKQNILKNCQSMFKTEEEFNILNDMIYDIHISKSKAEYEDRVKKFDKFYILKQKYL